MGVLLNALTVKKEGHDGVVDDERGRGRRGALAWGGGQRGAVDGAGWCSGGTEGGVGAGLK